MIQESKKKKKYFCVSFLLRKTNGFTINNGSKERLKLYFGINADNYISINDGFISVDNLFEIISIAINKEGVQLISVSEDESALRYHFIIE